MGELQKQSFVDEVDIILEDIYHWHTTILGPPNNPFFGGKFVLNIHFQPEHPFKLPRVRFQTKIFHPSISPRNGGISMPILREYWTSSITMFKLLDSIRSMLIEPNLEKVHPDVADIGTQLHKHGLSCMRWRKILNKGILFHSCYVYFFEEEMMS
ncbi:hypothetical protein BUALT_Bualt15G0098100 [Buddleja alternifolia]|uniref:UBC core domain-containing protein n=1 Tax=Buddleja alternifolia TaxID=168488 RepID=A0AAV6WPL1_9LAMI|nr:hypothetical protein BUALT_Bualt15G0098100 [Buddleja alternifolia]